MMNDTVDLPLPGIEHVVVVMFENRSFDNMLGGLYPDRTAAGTFDGVTTDMFNYVDPQTPDNGTVAAWQGADDLDTKIMPYPDPGELFADINEQLFAPNAAPSTGAGDPTMGGFVQNYLSQPVEDGSPAPQQRDIMQYFGPGPDGNLPVMTALAQAYAVSDGWFASGPVQTLVNRIFVHSAQPSTYTNGDGQTYNCIDNSTVTQGAWDPLGSVDVKTVFELLDATFSPDGSKSSDEPNWKVYYNDFPLSSLINYVYDRWGPLKPNVCHYGDNFAADVAADRLPPYSFIEPQYTNMSLADFRCQSADASYQPTSYHPGGACPGWDPNAPDTPPAVSVCFGEKFLADIYTTLASNSDVFKKTLLVVIFDEHGGLYDHVAPPEAVPPNSGVANFDYSRYGVRVPAIFINPYITPGTVFRSNGTYPFDHTTVIATLRAQFGLGDALTARDAHAPTLAGLLDPTTENLFSSADLPDFTCEIPPLSERGFVVPDTSDPNNLHAIIRRGMERAREHGKL